MKLFSLIKNDQEYNSILIIVCHVIKYALFILTWNDTTAADFAELFFEHVECQFDFSRSIVMNKDSQIISDFWQEVCEIQIIKQQLSIIYHSQIDSQSEVLNWIIEDYLRAYTFKNQMMWVKLLSLAQFVYNNNHNHIIQMSLNRFLHDFNYEIHIDVMNNIIEKKISAAKNYVKKLYKLW